MKFFIIFLVAAALSMAEYAEARCGGWYSRYDSFDCRIESATADIAAGAIQGVGGMMVLGATIEAQRIFVAPLLGGGASQQRFGGMQGMPPRGARFDGCVLQPYGYDCNPR